MRRKSIILFGSIAAIAFLSLYYFHGGSTVPNGQQPLVRLNGANLVSLKNAFNGSTDSVRVLVLVSPT